MPRFHELSRPASKVGRRLELRLLDKWRRAGHAVGQGDADAVHAFRAAQRRLEATLGVFHGGFAPALPEGLRRRLKRLGRRAGACRDLDVELAWLAARLPQMTPRERQGARWFLARLKAKRSTASIRLNRELKRHREKIEHQLRIRIESLGTLHDSRHPVPSAGALLARTIAARTDQLDLQLAALHSLRDWSEAHRARITVKRIRFLLEPFADSVPRAPGLIVQLVSLSDALGDLHDRHRLAAELRLGYREAVMALADLQYDRITPWPVEDAVPHLRHAAEICAGLRTLAMQITREAEAEFGRFKTQWSRRDQGTRLCDALRRLGPALRSPHLPPSR
jgi:CHAD domain-containing protein